MGQNRVGPISQYFLVTPGGCGTHYLAKFLAGKPAGMPVGWKTHRRVDAVGPHNKLVYLYANPYDTFLSFVRRGFLEGREHLRHLGADPMEMDKIDPQPWSMQKYLEQGVDFFQLHTHFMGWYEARGRTVMFVKYEELPQHLPRMLQRWGLPEEFADGFSFEPRASNWTSEESWVQERLEVIYGEHKRFLDSLEGCFVR